MALAMLGTAVAVGLLTLAVGLVAVMLLRLLPSLRLQLAGLAGLSVCLPLASVLLSGWVAFHMGDDVKILAVSAASATVAVVAGLVLARSIVRSVELVRDASTRLAGGDLTVRAPESGPTEVADLAWSFNEMATSLEQLFDARRELVAWASHDLRTPLANMQAMLEALEDGLVTPEATLPVLRGQVALLSSLVDDLFELARIDSGALTLELRESLLDGASASPRACPRRPAHAARPTRWSGSSSTCSRTRSGTRPPTARSPSGSSTSTTRCASRSRTRARAWTTRRSCECSTASGAATRPAPHAAPA